MKHLTASTSPSPFSGENWFDPLEDAIRFRVRAFIEAVVAEEAQAALGGRARYQRSGAPKGYRNGHRHRQLVGTFGALTVSLPRVRLLDGDGGEKEWRSQTIQAYKRLTKRAANASKDSTFLLADVEVVATYELYNINRSRLENIIHRVFESAKLDIEIKDRFGNPVIPREWFLVPLFIVDEVVDKIKEGTIGDFAYDIASAKLVSRDEMSKAKK